MSRIGKKPVAVPKNVDVTIKGSHIEVKGPQGTLKFDCHPNMKVSFDGDTREVTVERPNDTRDNRALHGLTRNLINNMVQGVVTLYEKRLEVVGVGYQATMKGKTISLQVGFANAIVLPVPENVSCECPSPTLVIVKSSDKQAVGQFAANIRRVRPPEPYKGKGIRYSGEKIRRKAGKAFAK